MIFTITTISNNIDSYEVVSDTGERKVVTGYQIVQVMVNGFKFTNAYLTKKGFAVIYNGDRKKYIQIDGIPKELLKKMAYIVEQNTQAQKQMQQLQKQPQPINNRIQSQKPQQQPQKQINKVTKAKQKQYTYMNKGNISGEITPNSYNKDEKVIYKGDKYSIQYLCKKYNRDVNTFIQLRDKGYSMDEALGLKPLRPESEVTPRKDINRMLNSLSSMHSEF